MNRRRFLVLSGAAVAAAAAGLLLRGSQRAARALAAVKLGRYPGGIKPVGDEIRQPGKWAG